MSGIYGPGRLIARAESLRAGTPLTGNPDAWLNLIHVDDAVGAVLACESLAKPGATYLVTDNRALPRKEFYAAMCRLIGAPPPVFQESAEVGGLNKRCSNRRLREELGVSLRYPTIEEGLPQALGLAEQ